MTILVIIRTIRDCNICELIYLPLVVCNCELRECDPHVDDFKPPDCEETKGNETYRSFPRANARTCSENGSDVDDFKPLSYEQAESNEKYVSFPRVDARTCS